jgi:tetratricopeptide (TPR) repeat protein
LDAAAQQPLLNELGAPAKSVLEERESLDQSLVWLHLGTAWLKMSVIADLAEFYCKSTRTPLEWLGYGRVLTEAGGASGIRDEARTCFRAALDANGRLAEAHFALGRIEQLSGNTIPALEHFQTCTGLAQHPHATPDAHLKANAFWEAATILDDAGRDTEALSHYQSAISLLDSFGVHHVRYARFLRRVGRREEAADHYLACARYTHRYFPEFQPPRLGPAAVSAAAGGLDTIFTTPDGDNVYFHAGQYTLLPAGEQPNNPAELAKLFEPAAIGPGAGRRARLINSVSRLLRPKLNHPSPPLANSIAELV